MKSAHHKHKKIFIIKVLHEKSTQIAYSSLTSNNK